MGSLFSKQIPGEQVEPQNRNGSFLLCKGQLAKVRYKWDGKWYIAKIRSHDIDGTSTVIFEDGSLQIGTRAENISTRAVVEEAEHNRSAYYPPASHDTGKSAQSVDPEGSSDNIWAAARRGDLPALVAFAAAGGPAAVHAPEEIEGRACGRSPLYWACLCGHVDVVRYLLGLGAEDADGSALIAVTTQTAGDDNRDVYFDPDEGIYSDFIDYDQIECSGKSKQTELDSSIVIRRMLTQAKTTKAKALDMAADKASITCGSKILPSKVYFYKEEGENGNLGARSQSAKDTGICSICLDHPINTVCAPCGHAVGCQFCISRIRDLRQGCPVCRGRIRVIIPLKASPASKIESVEKIKQDNHHESSQLLFDIAPGS